MGRFLPDAHLRIGEHHFDVEGDAIGAHESMAATLRAGDVPDTLTGAPLESHRRRIEDQATLQEEGAVRAFESVLRRSHELTSYGGNTAYATRRLETLCPDDFPGLSEQLVSPDRRSSSLGKQVDIETSL